MEQITREQIIGLLRKFQQRMAAKRGMCDEHDRVLWDSAESIIAALQAAEPAAWQFYEDGEWHSGDRKIAGYRRNTEAAGIPVRDLFALPCLPAKAQVPDEREAFEAWVGSHYYLQELTLEREMGGDYSEQELEHSWEAWEARAMLTASPARGHSDENQQEEAEQPPLQLPDFCTDPDDSDEVASLWDHGFKRGWNSCLGAVAKAMQPVEQKPVPDVSELEKAAQKLWRESYNCESDFIQAVVDAFSKQEETERC